MDKSTHEIRIEQWKSIVQQCLARPEGQTASSWLAENGIDAKQYYYWQRQIRREAYEEMKSRSLPSTAQTEPVSSDEVTFAEVPVPSDDSTCQEAAGLTGFHTDAVVRLGAATIAVSNGASAELLSRIFKAVSHAC